ncbi:enolase C-terminal domain-like protein [Prosthecomicrobium sp. N25]|uniref:enolase C-terminal domain-like protein n=1 Tax=Prosthecomicrobium sp. N25 TaxID=3129254 RepID=UPI0030783892
MALTITSALVRPLMVPVKFALGTSAAVLGAVPVVLLDLGTDQGVTGRSYVFAYTRAGARGVAGHIQEIVDAVRGQPLTPLRLQRLMRRRLALIGLVGTVRMALSAVDVALWDATGLSAGLPLCTLLGGDPAPIRAYDSRGLGLMEPDRLADEAEALLAAGLPAVKLRLGYPTLSQDLAAIGAVRRRIGDGITLMVDYNQALTPQEAVERGVAIEREGGVAWIEEPIRHDDHRGNARIAGRLTMPVQLGENFNGPEAMLEALSAEACDLVMPDVARIGGVTGWMQAAGLAAARDVDISSHLMPEISVHLLAASPTADWLEYVDWADAFVQEPLRIDGGSVSPPPKPGLGLVWDEDRIARLESI